MTNTRRFYTGLIYFIVLLVLTAVRMIMSFGLGKDWTSNETDIYYTLFTQIFCMGILPFALYIILVLRKEKRPAYEIFKDFKYTLPSFPVIILAVISGFIFYYLTIGIASIWTGIITKFGYTGIVSPGTIYTKPGELFLWVAIIAVLPGIFEEFSHRGLLLNTYAESSEEEGIVFSALLFGLMHQDIRQFGYAVAGGVILGYFLIKSRSIIPPMILHFTNNAISCVLDYSSQTDGFLGQIQEKFFNLFDNALMAIALMLSWGLSVLILFGVLVAVDKFTARKFKTEPTWNKKFKFSNIRFNRNDSFLIAAIILGVITTAFSFIWSTMR